ncbi:MAG: metallophosphoesterase [Roseovarius sp.]
MTRRPSGKQLFRVALVSDTHVNEAEDFSASPYPANAEANPRARYVFNQINQTGAAFCVHLGDMVNPVPELPTYGPAADNFHAIASKLKMPLHLMPGNHDIGDKPVTWMPAGMVNGEHVALYREHFGQDYYSFDHGDCHFVIINSPLINSGDPAEAEQAAWLEADFEANAGRRIFMFSHYPLYVCDPAEPESYDNIDEPARGWLLGLIRRYKPEALFAAHVHNFWYDVIGETEYYVVPSTCFVRHDYSEMYRIDGGSQQGRNDAAKLGFLTLDIHEKGHVAQYHRSYGACLREGERSPPPVPARPNVKTTRFDGLYVDMRHAWAEEMVVAPSGAVDEFRRKKARNDYPVMALWEMGLRGLRVPLQDLADPATRRRMELMRDVGHVFHVYRYGLPTDEERALLKAHAPLVSQFELVLGWDGIGEAIEALHELRAETGVDIVLSRVNRKDAAKTAGGRYNHLISHGFTLVELEELAQFLAAHPGLVQGVQFTIPRSLSPWGTARQLAGFATRTGARPFLYVKSTEASPAERFPDEIANARRFGEAVLSAAGFGLSVILDTFDDADRGYFTRTGLVDRRFNPRVAGELVGALIRKIDAGGPWRAAEGDQPCLLDAEGGQMRLASPSELSAHDTWVDPSSGREGRGASGDAPALVLAVQQVVSETVK